MLKLAKALRIAGAMISMVGMCVGIYRGAVCA